MLKQLKYKNHPVWKEAIPKIKSTWGNDAIPETSIHLGLLCPQFENEKHLNGIPILSLAYDWKRI